MGPNIRPVLVTKKIAEESWRWLARQNNKSVEEMRQFLDECSDHAIRVMEKRDKLGKRAMRKLFGKWKNSANAKRWVCRKNRAHKMKPKSIVFHSRHHGEILMACAECACSYKMTDVIIIDTN